MRRVTNRVRSSLSLPRSFVRRALRPSPPPLCVCCPCVLQWVWPRLGRTLPPHAFDRWFRPSLLSARFVVISLVISSVVSATAFAARHRPLSADGTVSMKHNQPTNLALTSSASVPRTYDAARADMFVAIHSAFSNLSTSVVSESAVRELQLWLKRAVCCDMFDALIGSDMPDHPHSPTLRVKEVRELLNRCVATFAVKAWNMRTERSTQSPSSAG